MGNVTTSSNFRSAPTFAELNTGLAGMLSAGLIEREADRLRITMAGARLYKNVNEGCGSALFPTGAIGRTDRRGAM